MDDVEIAKPVARQPKPIGVFRAHVATPATKRMLQEPLYVLPIISIVMIVLMRDDLSWGLLGVLGILWSNFLIAFAYWLYLRTYRLFFYEDGFAVGNLVRKDAVWFWSFYPYSHVEKIEHKILEAETGRIKLRVKNRRFRIHIDSLPEEEAAIWNMLCERVDNSKLSDSAMRRLKIVARGIRNGE